LFPPGEQGEGIFAFQITQVDRGGFQWNEGILIEILVADHRDLELDLYTIKYHEGSNTAVYSRPALPATYRLDKAAYDARTMNPIAVGAPAGAVFQRGQDLARTAFADLPDTDKFQKFTLQFPDGFKITEQPYLGDANGPRSHLALVTAKPEGVLFSIDSGLTFPFTPPAVAQPIPGLKYRIRWKFADKDRAQKMETDNRGGAAAAAAAAEGLFG
jgi:hypothetical protein